MFSEPFPKTAEWVTQQLAEDVKREFSEYRYTVAYHLRNAEEASRECSSALWWFQWGEGGNGLFVLGLSPGRLISNGDIALREAASALDTPTSHQQYSQSWDRSDKGQMGSPRKRGAVAKSVGGSFDETRKGLGDNARLSVRLNRIFFTGFLV